MKTPTTGGRTTMTTPPTIRVGQRLIRWDGTSGYVSLNSRGIRAYGPNEQFLVEWHDGESEYATLATLRTEGIRRGRGVMPWAQ